jgi:hypothetical protein
MAPLTESERSAPPRRRIPRITAQGRHSVGAEVGAPAESTGGHAVKIAGKLLMSESLLSLSDLLRKLESLEREIQELKAASAT